MTSWTSARWRRDSWKHTHNPSHCWYADTHTQPLSAPLLLIPLLLLPLQYSFSSAVVFSVQMLWCFLWCCTLCIEVCAKPLV
jgi:hypothetical protein